MKKSTVYLITVTSVLIFNIIALSDLQSIVRNVGLTSIIWGFFYVIDAIEESKQNDKII